MRPLSASELLRVWERGSNQSVARRVLTLLAAACPEIAPEALAKLGLGRRDSQLLTLRELIFGPQLVGLVSCPACSASLELAFNVDEVRIKAGAEEVAALSVNTAGYVVEFRLPNSFDLEACLGLEDMARARQLLLERCLLAAQHQGDSIELDQLPPAVFETIEARMAEADPQADIRLDLACPACDQQWQATFDIVSYFWSELTHWAYRTLHEVHVLAVAYGWREADILALGPWRRQFYLQLISGAKDTP